MPLIRSDAPLRWPEGLADTPRSMQRNDHGFSAMSLADAINYLEQELVEMGTQRASLSLDIEQPLIERLRKKVGSRTGACLQFRLLDRNYVMACDRWQQMEHNIYALHLILRHCRNAERWGVGSLDMLIAGFEAGRTVETYITPPQHMHLEAWMEELGLGPTATLDDAVALYHRRAKLIAHDEKQLTQLNILMEQARAYFAKQA